jgi:hypothetical protein
VGGEPQESWNRFRSRLQGRRVLNRVLVPLGLLIGILSSVWRFVSAESTGGRLGGIALFALGSMAAFGWFWMLRATRHETPPNWWSSR